MRRIFASVFSKRDKDKAPPDARTVRASGFGGPVHKLTSTSVPILVQSHNESSASSSSVCTPDLDDDLSPAGHLSINRDSFRSSRSSFWNRLSRRTSVPTPDPEPKVPPELQSSPQDDHDVEDNYGDPEPPPELTPLRPSNPLDTFVQQTRAKLDIPPSCPPLIQSTGTAYPAFPSSCTHHNFKRSLPQPTLAMTMFCSHLLNDAASRADEEFFLGFHAPSQAAHPTVPDFSDPSNEPCIPKDAAVSSHCEGLQRWAERPCFEDRHIMYVATSLNGETLETPVTASFAIASLEYSAHLENLAASDLQPLDVSQTLDAASTAVPPLANPGPSPSPPLLSIPGNQPRNSYGSTDSSPMHSSVSEESISPSRRVVRFAPEDGKDDIPLGYAVRKRQQQVARAKFLREEKERRAQETRRVQAAQEQLCRDQERLQREKERLAREQEKRAMEEDRKKQQYAAAFSAARHRQETSRAGGSNSPSLLSPSGSYSSLRDTVPPPKRSSTSPASRNQSTWDTSSRPASSIGPYDGTQGHSRPSSLHSVSSDDSRVRDAGSRRGRPPAGQHTPSDRSSLHSLHTYPHPTGYPTFSPSTFIPPVPNYFDMPLIPPTPPFVLQQYPRRQQSHSPSPARSPYNPGGDWPNTPAKRRDGSSPPHPGHHRSASGDSSPASIGSNRKPPVSSLKTNRISSAPTQRATVRPPPPRRQTALS